MAQTTVWQIVIGAILMTGLITGFFTLISLAIPSNAGNFTDYNRTFNKFDSIKTNMDQITTDTENAKPDEGVEGILSGLYSSSFGAMQNVWTSITTMKSLIGDMSKGGFPIQVPTWFTAMIVTIITITVAMALIAAWQKWYT